MPENRKVTKIVIDTNACIGAGTCLVLAPNAFELNSNGIAVVKSTAMTHTDQQLIDAAKSCPTTAIKLFDIDNNQI